jgi:hypothetical protein
MDTITTCSTATDRRHNDIIQYDSATSFALLGKNIPMKLREAMSLQTAAKVQSVNILSDDSANITAMN